MTETNTPGRDAEDKNFGAGLKAPGGAAVESDGSTPSKTRTKKRGSRGGRRRRRKPAETAEASASGEAGSEETKEAPSRPRRARGPRRKRAAQPRPAEAADAQAAPADEAQGAPSDGKKRRRRGKRGGRRNRKKSRDTALEIEAIPGEDDDLPELNELPREAELVSSDKQGGRNSPRRGRKKSQSRSRSKRASTDEVSETATASSKAEDGERSGVILVNARHPQEVRVAVVEDDRILDLQMTVERYSSYVNDIYRGRVVNLEPAIGAAFVDFGQGRNGFLHTSDVLSVYGEKDWSLEKLLTTQSEAEEFDEDGEDEGESEKADEEAKDKKEARGRTKRSGRTSARSGGGGGGGRGRGRRPRRPLKPIESLLKKGQMVVVQITKDAIGDKGPALTTHISIPGRYLVLMPSLARTGVSRKIDDDKERRRLKRILQSLEIPAGMGVIVRTAGIGKTKAEIKRDLDYLLIAWEEFSRRLVSGRNPAPLYQESDVSVRTMRDLFSANTEKVVVDDESVYKRMVEFTEKLMPENLDRIVLHDQSRPIFNAHGVEQDFEKIFQRRVELPSGGSIVIDQTEALVAIDVNSGRTRDEGADFEDIALKANLEAAPEIARQIRLRDMGGIIVLDFIDMLRVANRREVERAFRDCLVLDRARSKVGRISQFGLLELTRQRLGPGVSKLIFDTCAACRGTGHRRSPASRAHGILRRLGTALTMKGFTKVEVRAHADAVAQLERQHGKLLESYREDSGRDVVFTEVSDQVEDSVLRYLRADGREVRPGGRRKK